MAANISSMLVGSLAPALASTALLNQTQFSLCRLTGTAKYLPLTFTALRIFSGSSLSQLPFLATSSRSFSRPSLMISSYCLP